MKILCIGRNYVAHAKELGNEVPEDPVVFIKPSTALLPTGQSFSIPSFTKDLHYECELVLRIAKNARNISKEEAATIYDAITAGIDFTARDVQQQLKNKGLPWEKAKAFDGSAVVGRWITATEFTNKSDIHFGLKKNSEWVQQGHTANLIFDFDTLLAHLSLYFTLEAGDLVYTGTPAGVGPTASHDVLEGFVGEQSVFQMNIQ
ncbi:MAG: fumarylacetoacetate hydrolase family protein [Chitinophagaceae bacterium]|jgi:2-keto-4-pentenoate hydratase/2-oxohepta-3-ene-1,7-dioic acid hydratase in catechol pathway